MSEKEEPLDQLFAEARQSQERVAAAVEIGVEARLHSCLTSPSADEVWLSALVRLCSLGGVALLALGVWVLVTSSETQTLASLIVEQWVLGI
ncbi:MAG: hypothetical protein AAF226_04210 [Verrucomicrobiota bacterium]